MINLCTASAKVVSHVKKNGKATSVSLTNHSLPDWVVRKEKQKKIFLTSYAGQCSAC
uniref:Uncharacterized protein n=1 Tax=Arion vulgaris TaxID=1028688 RepID=A0A0B7BUM5_9EUPU